MIKIDRKLVWGGAALGIVAAGVTAAKLHDNSVEKPRFAIVEREGEFEIRDYPAMLVAETWFEGEHAVALNQGFRALASYIYGKSRPGEAIPMTAPVFSDRKVDDAVTALAAGHEPGWRTRFVMPASYTKDTLPRPQSGVVVGETPARRVGVVRFGGWGTDLQLAAKEHALRNWLEQRGHADTGRAEYAYYNSPFVPGFLRRNEVLIPLR